MMLLRYRRDIIKDSVGDTFFTCCLSRSDPLAANRQALAARQKKKRIPATPESTVEGLLGIADKQPPKFDRAQLREKRNTPPFLTRETRNRFFPVFEISCSGEGQTKPVESAGGTNGALSHHDKHRSPCGWFSMFGLESRTSA